MSKERGQGGYLIAKINQVNQKVFDNLLSQHSVEGVDADLANLIFILMLKNGQSAKELSKATGISKSTLSNMIDRLEKSGWIKRVPSKTDRRSVNLELTKSQKETLEKFGPVIGKLQQIFYNGFSAEEVNLTDQLLERVDKNFTDYLNDLAGKP